MSLFARTPSALRQAPLRLAVRPSTAALRVRHYAAPSSEPSIHTQLHEKYDSLTPASEILKAAKGWSKSPAMDRLIKDLEAIPDSERAHSKDAMRLLQEIVELHNKDGEPRADRIGHIGETFKRGDLIWLIGALAVFVPTAGYLLSAPSGAQHHPSGVAESEKTLGDVPEPTTDVEKAAAHDGEVEKDTPPPTSGEKKDTPKMEEKSLAKQNDEGHSTPNTKEESKQPGETQPKEQLREKEAERKDKIADNKSK
ncbi:hypothetical protein BT69DRAFT_106334 [Atractiella rhizophila]|nr:hypothetical protein BT69DRAFT_106334 [Atractiella rhizophila]